MEDLIENSYNNSSVFNLTNQTCLTSNLKENNDTLISQESNNILSNEGWFDKYLITSKITDSSPDMALANTSINTERNSLSNANPTPCIKFGMQNRVKMLFKRNKTIIENENCLKKLDGLLNSGFDIDDLDSDV